LELVQNELYYHWYIEVFQLKWSILSIFREKSFKASCKSFLFLQKTTKSQDSCYQL